MPQCIRQADRDIPDLVEEPLQRAVRMFYDRNIQTTMSSANIECLDIDKGRAWINLRVTSPDNKRVIEKLIASGQAEMMRDGETVKLFFEIDQDDPNYISKVDELSCQVAELFTEEPFLWCPRHTAEEVAEWYGVTPEEVGSAQPGEFGVFFDPRTGYYFYSQEHIDKFHRSMDQHKHDEHGVFASQEVKISP